ncbi:MAG: chemotaxis protein CheW [Verrucomicrobiota bacterium]
MNSSRQICTFLLNGQLFGLDVDCVLEVIRSQPLTIVPLAPDAVCGLINLRGQIVTAIDLRRRLELPISQDESTAPKMNIIIKTAEGPLCFPIDDVGDVMEVSTHLLEPVPESMTGVARKMIDSVCKLPTQLLLVLKSEFTILAGA